MLFSIDKNKSLAILQAAMALFIVLAPTLVGMLGPFAGAYAVSFFSLALLLIRLKDTEKIYVSRYHFVMLTLLFYSLVSSIWASNREGHLIYLFIIGAVTAFFSLAVDYFSESSKDTIARRMMYMLSTGGVICALLNIIYWVTCIVPVAGKESFSQGMGSADILAVFLFLCICASLHLLKGNSAVRRHMIVLGAALMLFSFVMCRSLAAWLFAFSILVIYVIGKKNQKLFITTGILILSAFTLVLIIAMRFSLNGTMFADAFSYALSHLFGIGGGFESSASLFKTQAYGENTLSCLFLKIFAGSGIMGLLVIIAIAAFSINHFIKLRTWESLIEMFLTVMMIILPFNGSFTALLLWAGLIAYNEQATGKCNKRLLQKNYLSKTSYVLLVACVISVMLMSQAFMRCSADLKREKGDYSGAYDLYRAAAAINMTDAQSCHKAAHMLRLGKELDKKSDEAVGLIDKAIKRDKRNLAHLEEKAQIYYACKEYEKCADVFKMAAKGAVINGKYNLSAVKALYAAMKNYPKGSSEAKRAYEEIVQTAQATEDLDYRKEINDIADKALGYTKGELTNAQNGN